MVQALVLVSGVAPQGTCVYLQKDRDIVFFKGLFHGQRRDFCHPLGQGILLADILVLSTAIEVKKREADSH